MEKLYAAMLTVWQGSAGSALRVLCPDQNGMSALWLRIAPPGFVAPYICIRNLPSSTMGTMNGSSGMNYIEDAKVDIFIVCGPYDAVKLHQIKAAWQACYDNLLMTFAGGGGHVMLTMRLGYNGPFPDIKAGMDLVLRYRYIFDDVTPTVSSVTVTGTLTPDATGVYAYNGLIAGQNSYACGQFLIYWNNAGYWLLVKQDLSAVWRNNTATVTGNYTPSLIGTVGTATVT